MSALSVPQQGQHVAAAPPQQQGRSYNILVNLAAPVFELILKMKTGAIQPSHEVRPVVQNLLQQLEQGAQSMGVPYKMVKDVEYALVAFVDETILLPSNQFPYRDEWEKNPLQLEHFGDHYAGENFFKRLETMLQNVEAGADVAEVYYMCLILGYKGKYNIYLLEEQLKQVIRSVGDQLRRVGRLRHNALSAHWQANDQPAPPRDPGVPLWLKIAFPAFVFFVLVVYAVFYLLLRNGPVLER